MEFFFATASRYLAGAAGFLTPLAITAGCLWLVILQVGTPVPAHIALAQTPGFGALTGALADGSPLHEQDEEYELAQERAA